MNKTFYIDMNKMEKNYWWYKVKRSYLHFLFKKLKINNVSILDIGCGTGCLLKDFKNYGKTYGIDNSKMAIRFCHQKGLKNTKKASIEKYRTARKYNVITLLDVIEHIKNDDKVIRKINSLLNANGYLFATTSSYPHIYSYWDKMVGHYRRYTLNDIKKLFEKNGFEVVYLRYNYALILFPVLIFRYFKNQILKRKIQQKIYETDFIQFPFFINELIYFILKIEYLFGYYFGLPFGLSIIVVGKKKNSHFI